PICALSPFLYEFQLLLSVVALIEFYFKLIICITIPEEPKVTNIRCTRKISWVDQKYWDRNIFCPHRIR
ncbi:MAG: hypothetical protein EWV60_10060, partial [Microcystis sp. Msp_OC_L_20101000_S702]